MASRTNLSGPATPIDVKATAKYFMNITDGKGYVIKAWSPIGSIQDEDVVVAALRTAAKKST